MDDHELLCEPCQSNLQRAASFKVSQLKGRKDGVFIADLWKTDTEFPGLKCNLCRLLYSAKLDVDSQTREKSPATAEDECLSMPLAQLSIEAKPPPIRYELRMFSFLQNYDGIKYEGMERRSKVRDAGTLVAVSDRFQYHEHEDALRFPKENHQSFSARVVPRQFDPQMACRWLQYCKENHTKLCHSVIDVPNLKVIDCEQRTVIPAPRSVLYLALSYVWGPPSESSVSVVPSKIGAKLCPRTTTLPSPLPKVIEDAIQFTKSMGFRYIWIDKYCIDQESPDDKHEQIQQMDLIYKGCELCIIAAARGGENTGLSGFNENPRETQPAVCAGDITVISTLPHPHHTIKLSNWMKRGWTLQESILSRRRLVFTKDQVYFECNAMNCCEALYSPLDMLHTKSKAAFKAFMRAGIFAGRDEGLDHQIFGLPFGAFDDRNKSWSYYMKKFLILATNYTSRDLTFDSDSLNAFTGIMRSLVTAKFPTHQLLGLPFLFPDEALHMDCMVAALCWRHIGGCWKDRQRIKRRCDFPSWTWAGWAGTVSWTDLFTADIMDLRSLVENFHCQLEDGTMMQLHDYSPQQHPDHRLARCVLKFSAWEVPPAMISLEELDGFPSWKIGSFELDLHISEFVGSPEGFVAALGTGQLRCIFVAKGLFNSYFLIIEKKGGKFARRIGPGEALFFYDEDFHRFADEVAFPSAKKEVCLV